MQKSITTREIDWLWVHGFVILSKWIGPVEGIEYRLHRAGHAEVLKYAKGQRACYNAAVKLVYKGK